MSAYGQKRAMRFTFFSKESYWQNHLQWETDLNNKVITIWLVLLTVWVVGNDFLSYRAAEFRVQRYEAIEESFERVQSQFESLTEYVKGHLREQIESAQKNNDEHKE
jgi:hypothetical protein